MVFNIPLELSENTPQEHAKHGAAVLIATKVFNDYQREREILFGIGPELYVESWMRVFLQPHNVNMEDLIIKYFTKMLLKMRNNKEPQKDG